MLVSPSVGSWVKIMENPVEYTECNDIQKYNVSHIVDEFDEYLRNMSGNCMDIGCGPGDITRNILLPTLHPNAIITGTDISKNMIEYARKNNRAKNRLNFDVLDIETKCLPVKYKSQFNHVLSFHALHWCHDIRQAFQNIYDMLQPDGTMLVLLVSSHEIFDVFRTVSRDSRYTPYMKNVKKFISPFHNSAEPQKELTEILTNIGFKIDHCNNRNMIYVNKDLDSFVAGLVSILQFSEKISDKQIEELKKDISREYKKLKTGYLLYNSHNQDQVITLDKYKALIVYARKIG